MDKITIDSFKKEIEENLLEWKANRENYQKILSDTLKKPPKRFNETNPHMVGSHLGKLE